MAAMRRIISEGLIMTHGRTKNRLAIVWASTFRGPYAQKFYKEYVLLLVWVVQWARRNRLREDHGIVIVVDDTGRGTIEFCTSQTLEIARAAAGLAPVARNNESRLLFFNSAAAQTVASMLFKYIIEETAGWVDEGADSPP